MPVDRNVQARLKFQQGVKEKSGMLGEQDSSKLTPDEEKMVTAAVTEAGKMLYQNQQVGASVAKMIQKPPHAKGIGDASGMLTAQVDDQMNLPDDLVIPVGVAVCELVVDLGEQLGFYPESNELSQASVQATIKKLYEIYDADPADMEAAVGESGLSPEEIQGGIQQIAGGEAAAAPAQEGVPVGEQAEEMTNG